MHCAVKSSEVSAPVAPKVA